MKCILALALASSALISSFAFAEAPSQTKAANCSWPLWQNCDSKDNVVPMTCNAAMALVAKNGSVKFVENNGTVIGPLRSYQVAVQDCHGGQSRLRYWIIRTLDNDACGAGMICGGKND